MKVFVPVKYAVECGFAGNPFTVAPGRIEAPG